jgi:CHAT domain-containing protein
VAVRQAAVLTADYTGVPSWKNLKSAQEEAGEVAALFDPPATEVKPELLAVIDLFNSRPEYDVVHAALHGKYDSQGGQEGIVLLKRNAAGATAQFLTPTMLETGSLPHGPFVFLNACQVASDETVLGDYAGFASTLLRIGAGGVVAPLWNVRDDVAKEVARSFYAATLGADAVSTAEAMRAVRATYTEDGARTDDPKQHATLIAYQVFGHPRLHLTTKP